MITIIDTIRHSEEHTPINAAFSTIVSKIWPDEELDLYFQSRHVGNVSRIMERNQVPLSPFHFHKIFVLPHHNNPIKIFACYLISLHQDLRLLINAKPGPVFFLSANPFSLYFIKWVNLLVKKNVSVVLHAELEYLNKENDKLHRFPNNLMRKWYRMVFWKMLKPNFRYIVLGENIFNNVKKVKEAPFPVDRFVVIDHPYFYPRQNREQVIDFVATSTLNVGTIGHMAVAKNSHLIFELANALGNEVDAGKVSFRIIGNLSACMNPYMNSRVSILSNKSFMPRVAFEEGVQALAYILFFYSDSQYQFIASGVFFDAVAFEKPIIALRNSFFEHYFKRFGDIGFLCHSVDEMVSVLRNFDSQRYQNQVNNIRLLKEELSLDQIALSLKKQIKR